MDWSDLLRVIVNRLSLRANHQGAMRWPKAATGMAASTYDLLCTSVSQALGVW